MDTPPTTPVKPASPLHAPTGVFHQKKYRWVIFSLVAVAVLIVACAVWLLFFNKPKAVSQVTAVVSYEDVEQTVLATGALVPFVEINVGSRASGLVTSLNFDIGDHVRKGEVIAQIDSASQTNGLMTAQAALQDIQAQKISAQASLDEAQTAYIRQNSLYMADAGSKADLDLAVKAIKSAEALLKSINAQIKQAQVSVKTAEVNLGYTTIRAPIDGTVLNVVTKQGQTVNAAQSAPTIVTLGQLDKMTVEAEIAEADVINVAPGMTVYFTILGAPDHRYYGRIRRIQPAPTTFSSDLTTTTSTATAVYYYGLFDVANPDDRLKTTMTANVSVVLAHADHVLAIPSSALGTQNKDGSYVVKSVGKDKKTQAQRITVGLNDGSNVQVLSGLKEGDTVVLGDASTLPVATASASSQSRVPGMGRGGGL